MGWAFPIGIDEKTGKAGKEKRTDGSGEKRSEAEI